LLIKDRYFIIFLLKKRGDMKKTNQLLIGCCVLAIIQIATIFLLLGNMSEMHGLLDQISSSDLDLSNFVSGISQAKFYIYLELFSVIILCILAYAMINKKLLITSDNPYERLHFFYDRADKALEKTESVSNRVKNVSSMSSDLNNLITSLGGMAHEISSVFKDLVSNAQKTSDNAEDMAQSGGEMSSKVERIADSVEQMNLSLSRVVQNTEKASSISKDANEQAKEINNKMEALVETSKQIGDVVAIIKEIADQTNLLSLNATIEAARAGDAGKGFAIVAGEVKELARQSADSSDKISDQVNNIQSSVEKTVDSIKKIISIINEIDAINNTITESVEEQTRMSEEIVSVIGETEQDSRSVAEKAQESSGLVRKIAVSTDEVANTATELTMHLADMTKSSSDIARSSRESIQEMKGIINEVQKISRHTSSVTFSDQSSASSLSDDGGSVMKSLDQVSFGSTDIENSLTDMNDDDLDQLAFGVVKLDASGRVISYNAAEGDIVGRDPRAMKGKSFFTDIAPCTNTPEFKGKFDEGIKNNNLNVMFDYEFDYQMAPTRVKIHMKKGMVSGEYWIFVKRL
jgi:photoactive yellow protein